MKYGFDLFWFYLAQIQFRLLILPQLYFLEETKENVQKEVINFMFLFTEAHVFIHETTWDLILDLHCNKISNFEKPTCSL